MVRHGKIQLFNTSMICVNILLTQQKRLKNQKELEKTSNLALFVFWPINGKIASQKTQNHHKTKFLEETA